MENNQEKKGYWKSKVIGLKAKDIFELGKLLTELNIENFVIASTPMPTKEGYDCLVYIKSPPKEDNKEDKEVKEKLGFNQRPTDKQLRFLKEHRFKIEPNLTKSQATIKIKQYLDNLNKERPIKSHDY